MGFFAKQPKISTDEKAIDELLSRGVAEAIGKEKLREKLLSGIRLRVKLGIDPTSPHLHIGRAIPLLKLRDFQRLGHTAVFIVGDFTAVIGDTSDKEAERPMLSREEIEKNKKKYFEQMGTLIDLSQAELHHNTEWLEKITYRELGEQADAFSVADFIARDNIKRRLDAGKRVSLREVLYPLMQGYDSVAVHADVELGGMDQKFNILAGRALQEKYNQLPQSILLNPLIDGTDGRKMSSSWGNTIALTATPADMYGKAMSIKDEQVAPYFELCTRVSAKEVAAIMQEHPKEAKMRLAREIVTLYHGAVAAKKAEESFDAAFSDGAAPSDVPTVAVDGGEHIAEALIRSEVVSSKTELRRLLAAGAIREVGGETISKIDTIKKFPITLRIGKHRFIKLVKK